MLMPLCLEPARRQNSRKDAKLALGLPGDSVVILSIARAVKYRSVGNASFADGLLPVLRRQRRAHLIVVGPGDTEDWSSAQAEAPGRVLAFGERPDTKRFLEAADVYVDSFPFTSITSLFEAGLHGLPLVTRYPFPSGCEVMGADSVGLDAVLVRTSSLEDFQREVVRLISDRDLREDLGSRTRATIEATNTGDSWRQALSRVYEQAFGAPRRVPAVPLCEMPRLDDIDAFSPFVFGNILQQATPAARLANVMEVGLKVLPPSRRLRTWAGMTWRREFTMRPRSSAWRYLVPEWVTSWVRPAFPRRTARPDGEGGGAVRLP
jgi:hypothetical protein